MSPRSTLRLDTPDGRGGWRHEYRDAPLPADEPAGPYAIYLADDAGAFRLLCVDLDSSRGDVGPDLARLRALLAEVGISHVVAASGPDGGRHVWIGTTPAGLDAALVADLGAALARWLPTADTGMLANPSTGCARPPGSPHRRGGRAELVDVHHAGEHLVDVDLAGALAVLADGVDELRVRQLVDRLAALAPAVPRPATGVARTVATDRDGHPYLPGRATPLADLPDPVRRAIATTPASGRASEHLARVLLYLAHRHWTHAMVAQLVDEPGFEHIRTVRHGRGRVARTARQRRRVLAHQWARAVRAAATRPQLVDDALRAAVRAAVAAIRTASRTMARWRVQSGEADQAALTALCRLALAAGQTTISASVRQLAEHTGLSSSTLHRALHRLALDGRITLDTPAAGVHGATWQLCPPEQWVEQAGKGSAGEESPVGGRGASVPPSIGTDRDDDLDASLDADLAVLAADVFAHRHRHGGLGRQAARVYLALRGAERAVDARTVAAVVGHTPRTVTGHLRRMEALGLARRTRAGRWRIGRASLDAAARRRGCHGVAAARARRHAAQRAVWTWWCDELAWMHSPKTGVRTGPRTPIHQTRVPVGVPDRGRRHYPRTRTGRADHAAAADALDPTTSPPAARRQVDPVTPAPADEQAAIDLLTRVLGATAVAPTA